MVKRFDNYNDYELLYLIREGSEFALNYLFKKYDVLIYKIATSFYPKGDKFEDLLQEGRMVLYNSINKFDFNKGTSFYSFFVICLKRQYIKLVSDEYYSDCIVCEDLGGVADSVNLHSSSSKIIPLSKHLENTEYYDMFRECFIENITISAYAKKYNIPYAKCYRKYSRMLKILKNLLT